jgi:predicted site-specific integrase-resolvase
MTRYTTNEAGKRLGITGTSLVRYMKAGKIPMPQVIKAGRSTVHAWSDEDVENVRKLLPKIANGRKIRYKKKQSDVSNQQSAKTRRAQAEAPTLQKRKKQK